MSFSRNLSALAKSADGRGRLVTLTSILVLASLLVLVLAVLPASAGSGGPSGADVVPVEIAYGGGSGACDANFPGRLPSAASYELHINNPQSGTYTGPDGTRVALTVNSSDKYFDFIFVDPAMVAFDVVVNGGSKNTHFDYDGNGGPGPLSADTVLHAPTKGAGRNLYQLSHINICYDVNPIADLSVTKTPVPAVDPFVANVGDTVEFEIVVTNSALSTVAATGVTVTDTLPLGMEFSSASDGGTESPAGTVTWEIASIVPGASEELSLFVVITEDAAGQPVTNQVSVSGNEPDPTEENDNAESIPPVTVTADVSGTKFHDRDTDGTLDPTQEERLGDWTITAFSDPSDEGTNAKTDVDGTYTLNLEPGEYVICEQTHTLNLPPSTPPHVVWAWTQSELPESVASWGADCSGFDGYEPTGHAVTVNGDITGIDFGNHTQVSVTCSDEDDVVVALGGEGTLDNPRSTVTFPKGCASENYTTSFDVGRSDNDGDPWTQFVVFGGDPSSFQVLEQTILWDAEDAEYVGGSLVVPTTQVSLTAGGALQPVVFCSSQTSLPDSVTPQCLDFRTIAEGGPEPLLPGEIQLTEYYLVLGDPYTFR